ncbi:MAG TPA: ATP-binding cassette domain-containing protein [Firmicutes bacterium]|nr:ATP-binding cassette domain-containing protein [Bacillota bacterium]
MPLFAFEKITYAVGDNGSHKVSVSGSVDKGGVLAITGPSGSGKTTLLRILARLQQPIAGKAWLDGKNWSDFSPSEWRIRIHYLAQKPAFLPGTVLDNLKWPFQLAAIKKREGFNREKAADLASKMLLPGDIFERDAQIISGGEAVRVSLIRSLLISPTVLMADEPTAALDADAREAVIAVLKNWLRDTGGALLLVSHLEDVETFPSAAKVVIGYQGKQLINQAHQSLDL